jgi:hypothetical protein
MSLLQMIVSSLFLTILVFVVITLGAIVVGGAAGDVNDSVMIAMFVFCLFLAMLVNTFQYEENLKLKQQITGVQNAEKSHP